MTAPINAHSESSQHTQNYRMTEAFLRTIVGTLWQHVEGEPEATLDLLGHRAVVEATSGGYSANVILTWIPPPFILADIVDLSQNKSHTKFTGKSSSESSKAYSVPFPPSFPPHPPSPSTPSPTNYELPVCGKSFRNRADAFAWAERVVVENILFAYVYPEVWLIEMLMGNLPGEYIFSKNSFPEERDMIDNMLSRTPNYGEVDGQYDRLISGEQLLDILATPSLSTTQAAIIEDAFTILIIGAKIFRDNLPNSTFNTAPNEHPGGEGNGQGGQGGQHGDIQDAPPSHLENRINAIEARLIGVEAVVRRIVGRM